MVLDDGSMTWFRLHERRSSLHEQSKLNDTSARKQTFAAAMTQFEEQFTAAKATTAATRPLNLYYGLAQAGVAIAAAHAPDPWSFSRHGLRLGDRNPELADMTVGPEGDGGFQKVATATGSPGITAPVGLGTLWASLPDLTQAGTLTGSAWRIPLMLSVETFPPRRPRATLYLPGEMPEEHDAWMITFGTMMADYPSAAGYGIPGSASGGGSSRPSIGHAWLRSNQVACRGYRIALPTRSRSASHRTWTVGERGGSSAVRHRAALRPSMLRSAVISLL